MKDAIRLAAALCRFFEQAGHPEICEVIATITFQLYGPEIEREELEMEYDTIQQTKTIQ